MPPLVSVDQFRRCPDWRATFDAAYHVTGSNVHSDRYQGPIDAVINVFACARQNGPPYHCTCLVELDQKQAPFRFAAVSSMVNGPELLGSVFYFDDVQFNLIPAVQ